MKNSNYLFSWMNNELFCPFCGKKAYPLEESFEGPDYCKHVFVDTFQGAIFHASSDFIKVADELFGLSKEVIEDGYFDAMCTFVETKNGNVDALKLVDDVIECLETQNIRMVSFDLHVGSDVCQMCFVADDLKELHIKKPSLSDMADPLIYDILGHDDNGLPKEDPRHAEFKKKYQAITDEVWTYEDSAIGVLVTVTKQKILCLEYGFVYRYPTEFISKMTSSNLSGVRTE